MSSIAKDQAAKETEVRFPPRPVAAKPCPKDISKDTLARFPKTIAALAK